MPWYFNWLWTFLCAAAGAAITAWFVHARMRWEIYNLRNMLAEAWGKAHEQEKRALIAEHMLSKKKETDDD